MVPRLRSRLDGHDDDEFVASQRAEPDHPVGRRQPRRKLCDRLPPAVLIGAVGRFAPRGRETSPRTSRASRTIRRSDRRRDPVPSGRRRAARLPTRRSCPTRANSACRTELGPQLAPSCGARRSSRKSRRAPVASRRLAFAGRIRSPSPGVPPRRRCADNRMAGPPSRRGRRGTYRRPSRSGS